MQTDTAKPSHIHIRSTLLLTLTALIWGMAFVAQRVGMDFIGPFLFMSIRMFLGALTLLLVLATLGFIRKRNAIRLGTRKNLIPAAAKEGENLQDNRGADVSFRQLTKAGLIIGLIVYVAGSLQQIGLVFTPASQAGFLTALYIVLVPVLGIALKHKTYWNTWVSVLVAIVGLYFLSITESFSIEFGDLIILVAALFWAFHILATDHFVAGLNLRGVIKLCIFQFLVAAILSFLSSLLFDRFFEHGQFEISALLDVLPLVLYVGILSTGLAFTFQAFGQQGINPSAASIIMSLEAVFSLMGGILILHEILSERELIGCMLMFIALILSQLKAGRQKRVT